MWVLFDCPMARVIVYESARSSLRPTVLPPLRSIPHGKFGRRGKVFCFDKCKRDEPRVELGKLGCGPSRSVPGLPGLPGRKLAWLDGGAML